MNTFAMVNPSEADLNSPLAPEVKELKSSVRLREAFIQDHAQIAALHARNGLRIKSYEDWQAFWTDNPARARSSADQPIGWILEVASGEVVGFIGNISLLYDLAGRDLRVATPCGWIVDRAFRGYSIPILNRFLSQGGVDVFIFATVSPAAEPIYRSFQCLRAPAGIWNESSFWITRYCGFLRSVFRNHLVSWSAIAKSAISAPVVLKNKLRSLQRRSCPSLEIEFCSEFSNTFDDFWNELKCQNEGVLLAVRTREMLKWHFQIALSQNRAWVLTASGSSRLGAYAIFDSQDNPAFGLKRMRLVDFQALNGFEDTLPLILTRMQRMCRKNGVHMLEVTGRWLERRQWPWIQPPYSRTLPSWLYYYKTSDRELSDILRNPRVWAPSSFDGDASL